MKTFLLALSLISISALAQQPWQSLKGDYKTIETNHCDEYLRINHQDSGGINQLFFYAGADKANLQGKLSIFEGEFASANQVRFGYKIENAQGLYITALYFSPEMILEREVKVKVISNAEKQVDAFELRDVRYPAFETNVCFYELEQ